MESYNFEELTPPHELFVKAIRWPRLNFHDNLIEEKYRAYGPNAFIFPNFCKFSIIIFMLILIFRRIELLIFTNQNIRSLSDSVLAEYILTGTLGVVLIAEFAFTYFGIHNLKGSLMLPYCFFVSSYSSYSYGDVFPGVVPLYFFIV